MRARSAWRLPARPLGRGGWLVGAAAGLGGAAAWRAVRAHPVVEAARLPRARPTSWWGVVRETISDYSTDEIQRRGAALAYYTMFSMAPLVLIMVTIVGLAFGDRAAQGLVAREISGFVGPAGARALEAMIARANRPAAGTLAGLIGLVSLLMGAGAVVGELQASLAVIWGLSHKTGGLGYTIRSRILSIAFVLAMGFLLLVSLFLGAGISAAGKYVGGARVPETALHLANQGITILVIAGLFAAMFRYLPPARLPWRVVLVGGLVTALLFSAGNVLVSLYLGKGGPTSAYGAAGSILALLLWAYYTAQILYIGAEFTEAYAFRRGVALSRA